MIAQTGFDGKIQKFDKVRTDQLLWDVIETLKRIDPRNNIFLDISMLPDNPKKLKVQGMNSYCILLWQTSSVTDASILTSSR